MAPPRQDLVPFLTVSALVLVAMFLSSAAGAAVSELFLTLIVERAGQTRAFDVGFAPAGEGWRVEMVVAFALPLGIAWIALAAYQLRRRHLPGRDTLTLLLLVPLGAVALGVGTRMTFILAALPAQTSDLRAMFTPGSLAPGDWGLTLGLATLPIVLAIALYRAARG